MTFDLVYMSIMNPVTPLVMSSLFQLKETSEGLEEKLYSMRSELGFIEQIQDTMRKTRVQMKAEVPVLLSYVSLLFDSLSVSLLSV